MKNKKSMLTKRGSTIFLRVALLGLSALATVLGTVLLASIYNHWNEAFYDLAYLRFPVLADLTVALLAFYVAVIQAWKLLNYYDQNKAFSKLSVAALNKIKYSAFTIGVALTAFMPVVYRVADEADAPGLMIIGMVLAGTPIVVGVFAGVLQKILQNAIELKSENDLTV